MHGDQLNWRYLLQSKHHNSLEGSEGKCWQTIICKKECYHRSFISTAVRLFHTSESYYVSVTSLITYNISIQLICTIFCLRLHIIFTNIYTYYITILQNISSYTLILYIQSVRTWLGKGRVASSGPAWTGSWRVASSPPGHCQGALEQSAKPLTAQGA